jgi:hypothetical protein
LSKFLKLTSHRGMSIIVDMHHIVGVSPVLEGEHAGMTKLIRKTSRPGKPALWYAREDVDTIWRMMNIRPVK